MCQSIEHVNDLMDQGLETESLIFKSVFCYKSIDPSLRVIQLVLCYAVEGVIKSRYDRVASSPLRW